MEAVRIKAEMGDEVSHLDIRENAFFLVWKDGDVLPYNVLSDWLIIKPSENTTVAVSQCEHAGEWWQTQDGYHLRRVGDGMMVIVAVEEEYAVLLHEHGEQTEVLFGNPSPIPPGCVRLTTAGTDWIQREWGRKGNILSS